jgi:hypothetical protein
LVSVRNQFKKTQVAPTPSVGPEIAYLTVFGKTVVINIVATATVGRITIFNNVALSQLDRTSFFITPSRNVITEISPRLYNPILLTRRKLSMSHIVPL